MISAMCPRMAITRWGIQAKGPWQAIEVLANEVQVLRQSGGGAEVLDRTRLPRDRGQEAVAFVAFSRR
eukprot:10899771-Alexandrium_andersonii.AAC.1